MVVGLPGDEEKRRELYVGDSFDKISLDDDVV